MQGYQYGRQQLYLFRLAFWESYLDSVLIGERDGGLWRSFILDFLCIKGRGH